MKMIKFISGKYLFAIAVVFTLLSGSTAYSQKKSEESVPKGSVMLKYNYAATKPFKYIADTKIVQDMDINEQSMLVNVSISMGCEIKSSGRQGENLTLEIMIDSMIQNVESPQGSAGGSINDVKGKVFNMIISPAGKTIDLTEASKIVYTIEGSGENSIAQEFLNYFPALPKGPVKTGDTWISNDTIDSKTPGNSMWTSVEASCKFEGIEKIDGIDCARISATLSGTRKMATQTQGMDINTSGPFTGTQIILFAVTEGYFIKESVTTRMTGVIEMPNQNMSFTVVMDMTYTNGIVK
ncbi:MAG: hypothetical protein WCS03_18515 [Bacteroidota bacterium]